ncbi:hypothetical protein E2C01_024291 [Portunus trituberculatus]|uniref:Uncharacterized protein n=1 Tax=Portunus trituberculatus TaxID=210409 RepID=A0A5B7ECF0_PORTR|nr:hypothetical protein [Portunus trituberculatus]
MLPRPFSVWSTFVRCAPRSLAHLAGDTAVLNSLISNVAMAFAPATLSPSSTATMSLRIDVSARHRHHVVDQKVDIPPPQKAGRVVCSY